VTFAIARPVQGGVFARRFGERQSHDPLGHLRTQGALAVQRGRSIELRPSEMCLTSLDHIGESRLSEGGRYTALRMPRRDLMAMSKNIENKIAKPLQGSPVLRDFISGYYTLCAERRLLFSTSPAST
jgi:hypothetical protein